MEKYLGGGRLQGKKTKAGARRPDARIPDPEADWRLAPWRRRAQSWTEAGEERAARAGGRRPRGGEGEAERAGRRQGRRGPTAAAPLGSALQLGWGFVDLIH